MKRFYVTFITMCLHMLLFAQSPVNYSKYGWSAWSNENYEECKDLFEKGAKKGEAESMGGLAYVYMSGLLKEGRDIEKALYWARKGYELKNGCAAAVVGLIYCHSYNNYKEARPFLLFAYHNSFKTPHIGNLICASYIIDGDRESAKKWADEIYDAENDSTDDLEDYAEVCSLLAKLAMDDKDYFTAMQYAEKSTKAFLSDKAPYNPLAFYVLGRSQLSANVYPKQGWENVRIAANYEYKHYLIIHAFKDEIEQYWQTIKQK